MDPVNLKALGYAGFNVMNFAHNHTFDWGVTGMEDTMAGLKEQGIAVFGAGKNIDEARKPVVLERKGTRVGFLGYWCGDPPEARAAKGKPGAAFIKIHTHYEPVVGLTGVPAEVFTFANPTNLEEMVRDIRKLRSQCDVLVVSLHMGLLHVPMELAMYDKQVARAAVDAGADLILGHHAHILKGIEFYRGKPIFYGLCNLVFDQRSLVNLKTESVAAQTWGSKRMQVFKFQDDPDYPTYRMHPEAKQTMIAKLQIENGKISRVSYLPCYITKNAATPEILKHDERGQENFDYMVTITKGAGLNAEFAWDGDEIVVSEGKELSY
jgi:poly-gamma-glutamate synthesis protein (capsule biosynthesis protein)